MYKYPFHIDVFFWKMHGQNNEANTMSPYIYKKNLECNESGIPVCQKLTANMVV